MRLGAHAYAWCSQWSNETLDVIDRVKDLGLDFIEIPLMNLETVDAKAVRSRLQALGLAACTSTVLSGETDITSDDETVRRKGIEYLQQCVARTGEIGASTFSGVLYSQHVKPATHAPTSAEWQFSADALREVACFAQDYGVQIALEPVNRYETYLVNTCEQTMRLRSMVGSEVDPIVKTQDRGGLSYSALLR